MDRHEYINYLISLDLKGINKDLRDKKTYDSLSELGITEAFKGFTKEEQYFIAAFIKKYRHIFYVELIRRVYGIEIWKRVDNYGGDVKRINWEYHKYFFHQYVGPFFYINGEIKALTIDLTDGKFDEEFINHKASHFEFFNRFNIDPELDYGNFPRGRVIFNNKTNQFYLYVDKDLIDKKEIIKEIKKLYNFTSDNIVIKVDSHYSHDSF